MLCELGASLAQRVKNLPAMQETQVHSLHQEDSLEKRMATNSFLPAWRIPWTKNLAGYSPWDHKESTMTEQLALCEPMWRDHEMEWELGSHFSLLWTMWFCTSHSICLSLRFNCVGEREGTGKSLEFLTAFILLRTMAPLTYRDTLSSNPRSPKEINSFI